MDESDGFRRAIYLRKSMEQGNGQIVQPSARPLQGNSIREGVGQLHIDRWSYRALCYNITQYQREVCMRIAELRNPQPFGHRAFGCRPLWQGQGRQTPLDSQPHELASCGRHNDNIIPRPDRAYSTRRRIYALSAQLQRSEMACRGSGQQE